MSPLSSEGTIGSGEGALHSRQKICQVFGVKECILVHFSQRNISNFLARLCPISKSVAFSVS